MYRNKYIIPKVVEADPAVQRAWKIYQAFTIFTGVIFGITTCIHDICSEQVSGFVLEKGLREARRLGANIENRRRAILTIWNWKDIAWLTVAYMACQLNLTWHWSFEAPTYLGGSWFSFNIDLVFGGYTWALFLVVPWVIMKVRQYFYQCAATATGWTQDALTAYVSLMEFKRFLKLLIRACDSALLLEESLYGMYSETVARSMDEHYEEWKEEGGVIKVTNFLIKAMGILAVVSGGIGLAAPVLSFTYLIDGLMKIVSDWKTDDTQDIVSIGASLKKKLWDPKSTSRLEAEANSACPFSEHAVLYANLNKSEDGLDIWEDRTPILRGSHKHCWACTGRIWHSTRVPRASRAFAAGCSEVLDMFHKQVDLCWDPEVHDTQGEHSEDVRSNTRLLLKKTAGRTIWGSRFVVIPPHFSQQQIIELLLEGEDVERLPEPPKDHDEGRGSVSKRRGVREYARALADKTKDTWTQAKIRALEFKVVKEIEYALIGVIATIAFYQLFWKPDSVGRKVISKTGDAISGAGMKIKELVRPTPVEEGPKQAPVDQGQSSQSNSANAPQEQTDPQYRIELEDGRHTITTLPHLKNLSEVLMQVCRTLETYDVDATQFNTDKEFCGLVEAGKLMVIPPHNEPLSTYVHSVKAACYILAAELDIGPNPFVVPKQEGPLTMALDITCWLFFTERVFYHIKHLIRRLKADPKGKFELVVEGPKIVEEFQVKTDASEKLDLLDKRITGLEANLLQSVAKMIDAKGPAAKAEVSPVVDSSDMTRIIVKKAKDRAKKLTEFLGPTPERRMVMMRLDNHDYKASSLDQLIRDKSKLLDHDLVITQDNKEYVIKMTSAVFPLIGEEGPAPHQDIGDLGNELRRRGVLLLDGSSGDVGTAWFVTYGNNQKGLQIKKHLMESVRNVRYTNTMGNELQVALELGEQDIVRHHVDGKADTVICKVDIKDGIPLKKKQIAVPIKGSRVYTLFGFCHGKWQVTPCKGELRADGVIAHTANTDNTSCGSLLYDNERQRFVGDHRYGNIEQGVNGADGFDSSFVSFLS